MSSIPADLRYAKSHEWLRRESDGTVTVGITDYAKLPAQAQAYLQRIEQVTGVPVHILLSKSDKLTRQHAQTSLSSVQTELRERGLPLSVQLFSSTRKVGIAEAAQKIHRWFSGG